MPQLAAIAIENNTHPDCIGNSAQVGRVCRKLACKYPGDCCLPDSGFFADLFLADASLFRNFGEAGGEGARVIVHCRNVGVATAHSQDF